VDFLNLAIGLTGLLLGSEFAVRGSLGLARHWGWPDWLAGLLLLSLGTSLPELFVSVAAASEHPLTSLGNVFGSNAFNTGMVLGAALLFSEKQGLPLPNHRTPGTRTVLWASFFVCIFGFNFIGGAEGSPNISVLFGAALLLAYCWVLRRALKSGDSGTQSPVSDKGTGLPVLLTLGGFILLAFSSGWFLNGALGLAAQFGWKDGFAGYLIAAVGTSAPELFTCIRAVRHRSAGAVYGNILGSNAFNLLVVGGASTVVAGGIHFTGDTQFQATINLVVALVLFWIWTFRGLGRSKIPHFLAWPLILFYIISAWSAHSWDSVVMWGPG
jgi:cation:H+ antiporter